MKKSLGFTLAEVLITLAIIGVVAAMTIPSVIVNTNQAEFRTGFKKAVSVLNSAISMNTAIDGESPGDTDDLYKYFQTNMSITSKTEGGTGADAWAFTQNAGFYTTDGIRYEFPKTTVAGTLHEGGAAVSFGGSSTLETGSVSKMGKCGSANLGVTNGDPQQPCLVIVDVNGEKKPNPGKTNEAVTYTYAKPGDSLIKDVFPIMITEQKAVPFGVVAQQTMYKSAK